MISIKKQETILRFPVFLLIILEIKRICDMIYYIKKVYSYLFDSNIQISTIIYIFLKYLVSIYNIQKSFIIDVGRKMRNLI